MEPEMLSDALWSTFQKRAAFSFFAETHLPFNRKLSPFLRNKKMGPCFPPLWKTHLDMAD
jgi:hypothetical protein